MLNPTNATPEAICRFRAKLPLKNALPTHTSSEALIPSLANSLLDSTEVNSSATCRVFRLRLEVLESFDFASFKRVAPLFTPFVAPFLLPLFAPLLALDFSVLDLLAVFVVFLACSVRGFVALDFAILDFVPNAPFVALDFVLDLLAMLVFLVFVVIVAPFC